MLDLARQAGRSCFLGRSPRGIAFAAAAELQRYPARWLA
jgi:hypothetical protein